MTTASRNISLPAEWRDFWALTKPRVMSLVVFTALCGLLAAPGHIHPVIGFTAILCIALGAGACGALNQWYEADVDAKMARTSKRPLPAGRMDREAALHFGIGLAAFSVGIMGVAVNWISAGLLAFSIFFYAVVYTIWLKPNTPQNIVIGGAAGAFPPVIGWAAVTGDVTLLPILLFSIIFLWTPPHFWALALFMKTDYGAAGIPMLPNVSGQRVTRNQIFGYSFPMAAVAIAPFVLGESGWLYGMASAILSLVFLMLAFKVWRNEANEAKDMKPEKQLFAFSILYLFLLFAIFAFDRILLA
ncbi:heme o synthase [Sphingorhabdus contaminans]|jgi:protoheme IX farnesyltransferase|uniref:Protoheme IX farnesyltransferase n=1 Tax=Sphingorhabdus contaminans TaxID=1343899 RepID=A0A553WB16_9SPHN|nr:heme o synthase [Sphingorhabdus contaminans]TSB01876.1 protoheme IX farnesyltransferase [Sphingorhabdus contaminans]